MHAWSEVEHDLAYKTKKGLVSYDEYEALDEINGLVIAGEISLQRLQRISNARMENDSKSISNHYQLASYLYEKVAARLQGSEIYLGDVDALFKLYSDLGRITLKKIDNDLEKVDFEDPTPVAQQLVDMYSENSLTRTKRVISNKARKAFSTAEINPDDAQIGAFLKRWISLEKKLHDRAVKMGHSSAKPGEFHKIVLHGGILPDDCIDTYQKLRFVRNKLVHGMEIPSSEEFRVYELQLDEVIRAIDIHI